MINFSFGEPVCLTKKRKAQSQKTAFRGTFQVEAALFTQKHTTFDRAATAEKWTKILKQKDAKALHCVRTVAILCLAANLFCQGLRQLDHFRFGTLFQLSLP